MPKKYNIRAPGMPKSFWVQNGFAPFDTSLTLGEILAIREMPEWFTSREQVYSHHNNAIPNFAQEGYRICGFPERKGNLQELDDFPGRLSMLRSKVREFSDDQISAMKQEEIQEQKVIQAEAARQVAIAQQAEAARQVAIAQQAEAARQVAIAKQAEAARQAAIAKQAEAARQAEIVKQVEAARQAEIAKQAEAAREAELQTRLANNDEATGSVIENDKDEGDSLEVIDESTDSELLSLLSIMQERRAPTFFSIPSNTAGAKHGISFMNTTFK